MDGRSEPDEDGGDSDARPPSRRVLAAIAVGLLPWTVLFRRQYLDLFFSFGLVPVGPSGVTTVTDFYFRHTAGLPEYLNAWGLGVLLFAVGLANALFGLVSERFGLALREDPRITAAMYVFAGFGQLVFVLGFLRRPSGYVAVPLGTLLLWGLVWRYYRRDLASMFRYGD
ncbi:TIGR04206 family protein [Halorientalis sp. IM1011]|uniref:TIGR04206 family protein n=1 Tax=Halorientalis sp. IM1011 TaxID=1932360 RepID=UPI00097CC4A4|nr:TIGR04206 family protein [Halorientalis sp. IM1011]AQL43802.1 TIGR04206 family protein [Halorientalis sp. IM1011]